MQQVRPETWSKTCPSQPGIKICADASQLHDAVHDDDGSPDVSGETSVGMPSGDNALTEGPNSP